MGTLVERDHESIFRAPHGGAEIGAFLAWAAHGESLVVHHPRLRFDPSAPDWRQSDFLARPVRFPDFDEDGPASGELRRAFVPPEGGRISVFHDALKVSSDFFSGLPAFLQDTVKSARLADDEIGWYDTGFWAAQSLNENSIGLDEDGALEWLRGKREGHLAYALSSGGEIIIVTANGEDAEKTFDVDLYANNHFLPFAESRRIVHRGLDRVGKVESFRKELLSIEDLQVEPSGVWPEVPRFQLSPLAIVRAKPEGLASPEPFYYCLAMRRTFPELPWAELSGTSHFLATLDRGYWVDDDFDPNQEYAIFRCAPFFLRTCVLLDLVLTAYRGDLWH